MYGDRENTAVLASDEVDRKSGKIEDQFRHLEKRSHELETHCNHLQSSLQPILQPRPMLEGGKISSSGKDAMSPFAERLSAIEDRLRHCNNMLENICSSIEL